MVAEIAGYIARELLSETVTKFNRYFGKENRTGFIMNAGRSPLSDGYVSIAASNEWSSHPVRFSVLLAANTPSASMTDAYAEFVVSRSNMNLWVSFDSSKLPGVCMSLSSDKLACRQDREFLFTTGMLPDIVASLWH